MTSCVNDVETPRGGAAGDVFEEVRRVSLDTAVAALVGQLSDISISESQILVVDQMTSRIVKFSGDGQLLGAFGLRGEGPGEFRGPISLVELPDGTILVSESSPRLTRLTQSLSSSTRMKSTSRRTSGSWALSAAGCCSATSGPDPGV